MPKFVKLLIDDEATMLVNLETVTKIKDGDEEGLTAIYFIGSEHPLRVKDSGQDILRQRRSGSLSAAALSYLGTAASI